MTSKEIQGDKKEGWKLEGYYAAKWTNLAKFLFKYIRLKMYFKVEKVNRDLLIV